MVGEPSYRVIKVHKVVLPPKQMDFRKLVNHEQTEAKERSPDHAKD